MDVIKTILKRFSCFYDKFFVLNWESGIGNWESVNKELTNPKNINVLKVLSVHQKPEFYSIKKGNKKGIGEEELSTTRNICFGMIG